MNQEYNSYLERFKIHLGLMNLADSTKSCYISVATNYLSKINTHPKDILVEDIEKFVFDKNSPRTKEQTLSVLKHLYRNIFYQPEKVDNIPIPKREQAIPDILSIQEVFKVLKYPKNIKHQAILTLIYSCALRIGEAVRVKFEHIMGGSKSLTIWVLVHERHQHLFSVKNSRIKVKFL